MFRIRDHIISLVAVFFALGLGILIGTGMSDDMLVTQQRLLIEQMNKDYRTMREERQVMEAQIHSLTRDLYHWESYQEALYPGIVGGALAGSNIAIIKYGAEVPSGLLRMLEDADVNICTVIKLEAAAATMDAGGGLGVAVADLAGGRRPDRVAQQILDAHVQAESVKIQRHGRDVPDSILLMLGERPDLDVALVQEMVGSFDLDEVRVVALEWTGTEESLLGELKELGLSTVDNADSVFGQFSLLSVLRGSAGNFGIKTYADQFIATF